MKKSIIILDVETTDLTSPEETDLIHQPHLTEIYCYKVTANKKMSFLDEFHSLFKPPIPIPYYITKLTGIDDYTVKKAPTFLQMYKKLYEFFLGCEMMVAHNLSFELKMIRFELQRIGKEFNFPFPPIHYCTVEKSMHLEGIRLKNDELYRLATGKEIEGAHRAKTDVMATFESFKWLRRKEKK